MENNFKSFSKYTLQLAMKGENIPVDKSVLGKLKTLLETAGKLLEKKISAHLIANRENVLIMKRDQLTDKKMVYVAIDPSAREESPRLRFK